MDPRDQAAQSFLPVAEDSEFPIQNLPYGVFRRPGQEPRVGVRIGEHVLDLRALAEAGLLDEAAAGHARVFVEPTLNAFMALGNPVWRAVRARISALLRREQATLRDNRVLRAQALLPLEQVELRLPVQIGDYTDFYSSRQHAFNVGSMFRGPENALPPNYLWMPIGYHGRASSVVLSGTPIRRPGGQTRADNAAAPTSGPTRQLDFELEVGFFVGPGNALGEPIPIERAHEHIFGLVLVNDWSARDIQRWEYVPLGPFLGKNFATTISPWVVPLEALKPFRCAAPEQDPEPPSYLRLPDQSDAGPPRAADAPAAPLPDSRHSYDIRLEVALTTGRLARPHVICRTNFNHLYWTMAQQVAHHTINGCNLRPGDLLASGTISGPTADSYGSLLELAWRGERPLRLPGGEERAFLHDGDTVILRGWCQGDGYRIGFGDCRGQVLPCRE